MMKALVFCTVFFIGFFALQNKSVAQTVINSTKSVSKTQSATPAADGTYQVSIPNIKHVDLLNFSKNDLIYIEENRLQDDKNTVKIKDYDVLIMPKTMVDNGIQWAKFSIIQ